MFSLCVDAAALRVRYQSVRAVLCAVVSVPQLVILQSSESRLLINRVL